MACETQNIAVTFDDTTANAVQFDDTAALAVTFNDLTNVAVQCEAFSVNGFATYFEQVQDTLGAGNIVAHYKLDETTGTNAADSSGNANDGTYTNGPTLNQTSLLTQGGGTAVLFDGVNDVVSLPAAFDYVQGTGVFTISSWFNAASLSGVDVLLGNSATSAQPGITINVASTVSVDFANGSSEFTLSGASPISTGTLYHLVVTADGSTMTLYLNGVSDGTVGITPAVAASVRSMSIAAYNNVSGELNATIDETTFANVHSTLADVQELYNYGTA